MCSKRYRCSTPTLSELIADSGALHCLRVERPNGYGNVVDGELNRTRGVRNARAFLKKT